MEICYKSVAEFGKIITGKTPPTGTAEYWDGDIPFITPTDIVGYDMRYIFNTERQITETAVNSQKNTVLPRNTICVSCIASIGKMCITSSAKSITNQQINSIIVDDKNDYQYLFYLLRHFLPYIQLIGGGTGSGTPIISKTKFSKLKYPVCENIVLQRKIAAILSAYDNLIEANNKRIKILEQMAENLYKEWFVRFRFPGYETAEFENGIPKGWVTKTLNEWMIENYNGGWGEEIAMPKSPYEAAVIRGTDIEDVKASRYRDISIRYHKENDIKTKLLRKNDIVLELSNGNINNIGRTLFITKDILSHFDKVMCASFCKTLRFSDSRVAFFVWQYIEYLQNSGLMFFYKNTGANGINNFNFKRFLRMPISIPTDWKDFDILLKTHDEISIIREKNFNLIKQRDLLLPRLMSGKLEVCKQEQATIIQTKAKLSYDAFLSEFGFAARAKEISDFDLRAMYNAYLDDDATE